MTVSFRLILLWAINSATSHYLWNPCCTKVCVYDKHSWKPVEKQKVWSTVSLPQFNKSAAVGQLRYWSTWVSLFHNQLTPSADMTWSTYFLQDTVQRSALCLFSSCPKVPRGERLWWNFPSHQDNMDYQMRLSSTSVKHLCPKAYFFFPGKIHIKLRLTGAWVMSFFASHSPATPGLPCLSSPSTLSPSLSRQRRCWSPLNMTVVLTHVPCIQESSLKSLHALQGP